MRLLFLAFLVLAFAQPFFTHKQAKDNAHKLQIIYIDNSYSMSVQKGARSLLDIAKDAAYKQVQHSRPGTRFLLLTNDNIGSYEPLTQDKILTAINNVQLSPAVKQTSQLLATVQNLTANASETGADVYYYSDFQKSSFAAEPDKTLMRNLTFYGLPVQSEKTQNIYIDTAYLTSPVLQTGQGNQIIVRTIATGKLPKDMPVLQLAVNGQVKSAATMAFNDKGESIDTLSFQPSGAGWQQIVLGVNDASVRFDDTFRIAARSAPNLSVLVLNEGQPNPYIQAAFHAYNGFRMNQADVNNVQQTGDWQQYNLVILNGITQISDALGKQLATALQQGQTICLFPGKTNNIAALNEGLKQVGDIQVTAIDTAAQTASTLQQGSDLVKNLFEKIPDNVQLPLANWHYIIHAGLTANQQSVLSFRNGDPLLAAYTPSRGQLYICATSADLQSGNFPGSYFFAPFLYEMAMQAHSGDVFAITTGKQQPVYLSLNNAGERNMVHVYGKGLDIIPPQRPNGAGLDVYLDQVVHQSGFYRLAANGSDTTVVALNQDRSESALDVWPVSTLKEQWNGSDIKWLNPQDTGAINAQGRWDGFPLWKVCAILAAIMLAAETYLLAGSFRKQTIAAQ